MKFDDVAIFVIVLLALAGGINVIGAAIKTIKGWLQPISNNNDRIDLLERHVDNDNKRLNALEESNKLVLRGLNALIDHETSESSNTSELEHVQSDIQNYLLNR